MTEQIIILDFGSQYTQVIARRIRECNVFCTILPYDTPARTLADLQPKGLIVITSYSIHYTKLYEWPKCSLIAWPSLLATASFTGNSIIVVVPLYG